jgi:hypothetical protein
MVNESGAGLQRRYCGGACQSAQPADRGDAYRAACGPTFTFLVKFLLVLMVQAFYIESCGESSGALHPLPGAAARAQPMPEFPAANQVPNRVTRMRLYQCAAARPN